jgi:hypothetical protein
VSLPEQLPLRFKLDEKFVKVMSHWLHDGTAAQLGGNAFLVLCFIRSFVGSQGTTACPSQMRISKTLKLNIKTVRRCLEKLEELNFMRKLQVSTPNGKKNEYYLTELVLMKSENKEVHSDAVLQVPFGFSERKKVIPTLKSFERTGEVPSVSPVKIVQNFTINIQNVNGDNATVNMNVSEPQLEDKRLENLVNKKFLKDTFRRLEEMTMRQEQELQEAWDKAGLTEQMLFPEPDDEKKNK